MPQQTDFTTIIHAPKIITWDVEDTFEAYTLKELEYTMAIGLPPRNLINYNEGCFIMFRPTWRFSRNRLSIKSNVIECVMEIHFTTKKEPTKELLMSLAVKAHELYLEAFDKHYSKENNLYKFRPTVIDKPAIEDAIIQGMKESGWTK